VMNKLNMHDAAALTRYALRRGWISANKSEDAQAPAGI
jgi:hypothetical protein